VSTRRISARAIHRPMAAEAPRQPLEAPAELTFQGSGDAGEQLAPGDDDDVEAGPSATRAMPEGFAEQALRPVPGDGPAHSPTDGEAQAVMLESVGLCGDAEKTTVQAEAPSQNPAVVRTLGQPFAGEEARAIRCLRQGAATLRRACGPSGDGASAPTGRPSSSCAPESHGSSSACGCWAGRSASCVPQVLVG